MLRSLLLWQTAITSFSHGAEVPAAPKISPNIESICAEAEMGRAPAQCRLADFYFSRGDYTNAVLWYRRAAEQGEAEAETSLAACYANGRGVNKDLREASRWSRQAVNHIATLTDAEAGKPRAQAKLGDAFFVRGDYTNAAAWYRKAADQGEVEARISLASCYASGRGVPKDLQEAARWSRLAATQIGESKMPPTPHPPQTEPIAAAPAASGVTEVRPLNRAPVENGAPSQAANVPLPAPEPTGSGAASRSAPNETSGTVAQATTEGVDAPKANPSPAAAPVPANSSRVQRVASLPLIEPQVQEPPAIIHP